METKYLDFSIIFKVEHGEHFLRNALISAQLLDWPHDAFEIIVIGSDGDNDAEEQVKNVADGSVAIHFMASASPTFAGRLNSACAAAQGRILALADDDCELPPGWLQDIAEAFKAFPDAGLIGGVDELRPTTDAFSIALDCVLGSFWGTAGCRHTFGPRLGRSYPKIQNMAIKREIAERVVEERGSDEFLLFDEYLTVHIDVELAGRVEHLGVRAVMCPNVSVYHCRDTTFWKFLQRNFKMAQTSRLLGVHRLAHTALVAAGLVVLLLAVGALWSEFMRVAFGICIAVYCALLFWCALRGFLRTRKSAVLGVIPALLSGVHLARALGYVVSARRKK